MPPILSSAPANIISAPDTATSSVPWMSDPLGISFSAAVIATNAPAIAASPRAISPQLNAPKSLMLEANIFIETPIPTIAVLTASSFTCPPVLFKNIDSSAKSAPMPTRPFVISPNFIAARSLHALASTFTLAANITMLVVPLMTVLPPLAMTLAVAVIIAMSEPTPATPTANCLKSNSPSDFTAIAKINIAEAILTNDPATPDSAIFPAITSLRFPPPANAFIINQRL